MIETGATASWNDSTFCETPSSSTTRSLTGDVEIAVLRIGDREFQQRAHRRRLRGEIPGAGANRPLLMAGLQDDGSPRPVVALVGRRVAEEVAVAHVGRNVIVHRRQLGIARGKEGAAGRLLGQILRETALP